MLDGVIQLHRVGRDNVVVNGQKLKRNRDLFGTLKVSIFTPDDLDIVKGSSALRREIFDDTLSQISPKYVAAFSDYSRILKQKNALLKTMDFDRELLNVLNQSLVSSGSQLIRGRLKALTTRREVLSQSYSHIADENDVIDAR